MSLFPELDVPPSDRLFFGIFPPSPVAEAIAGRARDLKGGLGLSGAPLTPDRFHVTLHHIGDYAGLPRGIVAQALEAGEAASSAAPFEATFDQAASFNNRGNNPFVLQGGEGLAELHAFQKALGLAMAHAGLGKQVARQFNPHVTLLYDRALAPETPTAPVSWTVSEFVLIHSLLGQTRHVVLGRWPLKG
ncbi:2'-5' RNA ligase [Caulobacter flavus]|uniref:RNA 2',3'-cyclic phosphodiesterase n=1 Tax=Caulobacter flavus TaxID=1679497 RepID=A0A2N5CUF6_9CAUL|nr:2'-5' RNA ligase family protein [Caulobacter flavus]AYV47846.1 2'-5' RNA ligase [Caulobacter flavus]PLR16895.1 2'-5' RNA ligase [Caulobacter flavus]